MNKPLILIPILVLVNLACLSATAVPITSWPTPVLPDNFPDNFVAACEQQVIELVNAERVKAGLPALIRDETLMAIARERSEDMARRGYYSHYDPKTGAPLVDKLLNDKGYYGSAGENIGSKILPASDVANYMAQRWLNSAGHRRNIMDPKFQRTGVGCAVSRSLKKVYVTQVFTE